MSKAELDALARAKSSTLLIAICQAVVGSAAPISITLGGLAGHYLLGDDKALATLPVTGFNIGVAAGALPAAFLMRMVGRRFGFMGGALVTSLGGAIAASAFVLSNFWVLVFGLLVIGVGGAFVQQYRFAAADSAPPIFKPRAISWVLGGGVFAAIIGPQLIVLTRDILLPIQFAGAFLSVIGLGLVGFVVLSFLKIKDHVEETPTAAVQESDRTLAQIMLTRNFIVAFICGVTSYALMSYLMTGAPLAMVGCGFTTDEAATGIQWHVMAMFAPSFFTGRLIQKFGKETIVGAGLLILIACALIALSGVQLWQFWLALILLGIGWNFGFIGSTAMLTEAYRPSEKNKVQGVHDFALFTTVAIASLMSGVTINFFGKTAEAGWVALNFVFLPVAVIALVILLWHVLTGKKQVA